MIFKDLKKILVLWLNTEDIVLYIDFETTKEVADFIGAEKYFVEKVLRGTTISGSAWKPNIYFKNIGEEKQYRYIIVYRDDWTGYSDRKRENRIKKLTD